MATTSLLGYTLTISPPLLVALRIAPLVSTTASMTHAYMEWLAMTSFLTPPHLHTRLARGMLTAAPPTRSPPRQSSLTKKDVAAAANTTVPRWFVVLFSTGLYSVVTLNSLTLFSSCANIWVFPHGVYPLGANRKLYLAGLVAALGHYAFVPLVGRSVGALFAMCAGEGVEEEEEEGEGRAKGWVREWVGWHVGRWGSVDLVAWGSFWMGVVGSLGGE